MPLPVAFTGSSRADVVRFIRGRPDDFSYLRRVIVEADRTRILDVNGREMLFPGFSFGHPLLAVILREAGASFDPTTLDDLTLAKNGSREFRISAKYPWAHDRVD